MGLFNSVLDTVKVVAKPFEVLSPIVPWASAAASLYGGLSRNQQQTQAASAQQAFQQEMSGTAYQRAMADMKAAGLNPMLAAKLGGASTPAGAMPNLMDAFTPAMQTYQQAYSAESQASLNRMQEEQVAANVDQIQQQIKNLQSEDKRIQAATKLIYEQAAETIQRTKNLTESFKEITATIQKLITETGLSANQLAAEMGTSNFRRFAEQFGPLGNVIGGAVDAALGVRRTNPTTETESSTSQTSRRGGITTTTQSRTRSRR